MLLSDHISVQALRKLCSPANVDTFSSYKAKLALFGSHFSDVSVMQLADARPARQQWEYWARLAQLGLKAAPG